MKEVVNKLRRLHDEELCNLYLSADIVRIIELKTMWVDHVICMGKIKYQISEGRFCTTEFVLSTHPFITLISSAKSIFSEYVVKSSDRSRLSECPYDSCS
jgi:hypothetical protein